MNLFHQRGYDGVGVAELSQAIGIAAPSLYSAFGSKRELFEQVLQHYVEMNGCWLPTALATEDRIEDVVSHLFRRAAEVYTAHPDCPGCLILDGTRNCGDAEARALTAGFRQATRQLICDRITTGAPNLSHAAVNALSDYAITILVGLSGSARDGMTTEALKITAEIATVGFAQQLQRYHHQTDQSQTS
jgi:TetR/AcrR family transcriptional regulator, repressor for divergent bdcA